MVYIFAQFLLLGILAWPIGNVHFSEANIIVIAIGVGLLVSGMLVALLALLANRPGNFNVRPIPKTDGQLITTGIYQYIRHPMYCSLFFAGLGLVFCQFTLWKLVAWILLVLTLTLKARFEERALTVMYCDYEEYQKNTKAFIPLFW